MNYKKNLPTKKPSRKQHKDLLTDPRYRHHYIDRTKNYLEKKVLDEDASQQIKEYLNGYQED